MPDSEPEPEPTPKPPADDAPSKGDFLAIGIGCLVVLIFFVAIVLVGVMRE